MENIRRGQGWHLAAMRFTKSCSSSSTWLVLQSATGSSQVKLKMLRKMFFLFDESVMLKTGKVRSWQSKTFPYEIPQKYFWNNYSIIKGSKVTIKNLLSWVFIRHPRFLSLFQNNNISKNHYNLFNVHSPHICRKIEYENCIPHFLFEDLSGLSQREERPP